MSNDHVVLNMGTGATKPNNRNVDINDVEMVFGGSASPGAGNHRTTHGLDNEKRRPSTVDNGHHQKAGNEADAQSQPLLEPLLPRPAPPLAGPEIDDLNDNVPADHSSFPGIDVGPLQPNGDPLTTPELLDEDELNKRMNGEEHPETQDDGVGTEDGKWALECMKDTDEPDYYYGDLIHNRFGEDIPGPPMVIPGTIPDVNIYQQKKNLAQGMMDLALLSANANQLRYVLDSKSIQPAYFYFNLASISISIILQVLVGIGLILNSRYNVKDEKDICKADKINNMTVIGIFLITAVNVFISAFGINPTQAAATVANAGV